MPDNVKAILVNSSNVVSNITGLTIPGLITQGWKSNVVSVAASYTVRSTDDIIIINNSSGCTMSLPSASASGKIYNIKSVNVGSVVIDANVSGGTIDGELNQTINVYENITVVDYSANKWGIL
jgi:hypothetical protein